MRRLNVDLGERSYPIFIADHLLHNAQCFTPHIKGRQVAIVSNETIAPLYMQALESLLKDFDLIKVVLPDGESYKNLDTLNLIFDGLLQARHSRTTTLIALGGGVVGDMTGFAAACYQRGVDFIQVPTTLLSQVDSSVGGKTGVNHALGKNMIGAFYQPNAVIIDTRTLSTLPDREFSAGMAEVIKYGLICDRTFYDWLNENIESLMARNGDALSYAIHRSCADKANVVEQDEKESGIRAILNLGHTFGHAIETHMGYGDWLHGEAVAAGMVMAADFSRQLGYICSDDVESIICLLKQAGLPVNPPKDMETNDFLRHMSVDKKAVDGRIRLVLIESIGNAVVEDSYGSEALRAFLDKACKN